MKKSTSIYVLLILSVLISASHLSLKPLDNGRILVLDGMEIDIFGMAKNQWTKLTRNCTKISNLSSEDKNYQAAMMVIKAYSPPNSESLQIASAWSSDGWMLVEAEFTNLLPAVVAIKIANNQPQIIPTAIWSGQTHPWKAAPHIRDYIVKQAPDIPAALTHCFDPQSQFFQ